MVLLLKVDALVIAKELVNTSTVIFLLSAQTQAAALQLLTWMEPGTSAGKMMKGPALPKLLFGKLMGTH